MKNLIIGIIIIAIFATTGFVAVTLSQNPSQSNSMIKKDDVMIPKENTSIQKNNNSTSLYIQYNKSALDNNSSNRRVLFFYASWCPTCKPADESFTQNISKIPEDVTVIRINYNDPDTDQEEKDLAKNYGITYQHTFVQIDNAGKEITKWNGGQIDELLANIK